jgi:hypothetical protein
VASKDVDLVAKRVEHRLCDLCLLVLSIFGLELVEATLHRFVVVPPRALWQREAIDDFIPLFFGNALKLGGLLMAG